MVGRTDKDVELRSLKVFWVLSACLVVFGRDTRGFLGGFSMGL